MQYLYKTRTNYDIIRGNGYRHVKEKIGESTRILYKLQNGLRARSDEQDFFAKYLHAFVSVSFFKINVI